MEQQTRITLIYVQYRLCKKLDGSVVLQGALLTENGIVWQDMPMVEEEKLNG